MLFKGFEISHDGTLSCKGQVYKLGQDYTMPAHFIRLGEEGFHSSQSLEKVFKYYPCSTYYPQIGRFWDQLHSKPSKPSKIESKDYCYGIVEIPDGARVIDGQEIVCSSAIRVVSLLQGPYTLNDGTVIHFHQGRVHRTDGPAIISTRTPSYCKLEQHHEWRIHGKLHRVNEPAMTNILFSGSGSGNGNGSGSQQCVYAMSGNLMSLNVQTIMSG